MADADGDNQNRPPKRAYTFYERVTLIKANRFPDFLFRGTFRMWRPTFQLLLLICGSFIPIGNSLNGQSLQPPERLLLFLKFLGRNETYIGTMVSMFYLVIKLIR
jgi:hypothetical protein